MKAKSDIGEILAFLRRLEMHNERPWFKAHKAEYDALRGPWEDDMARLIELAGEWDEGVRGLDVRACVYRIYRDTRFSNDKRPYKNYFSGVIGRGGRHTRLSCGYVHFQPGNVMIGGGIWMPERPVLDELRSLIDAEADEFRAVVVPIEAAGYGWECATLKRMPKGYDEGNPMARFLKMKEYLVIKRPEDAFFECDDWVERVNEELHRLQPLHQFLNYVFDE